MVTNGGAVIIMTTPGDGVVFGQWVPMAAPAIVLSESTFSVAEDGLSATYTVKLKVRATRLVSGNQVTAVPGTLTFSTTT